MKVNPCYAQISYGAKLSNNTRKIVQEFDKCYKQNLEYKIDQAISTSAISDLGGDKATISFLETENPHCNIAPVVSVNINGVVATHVLKGASPICEEQDEEFLIEKMQRRPYRYINTIINHLNSEPLAQIKKSLALDYIKKINSGLEETEITDKTFDEIIKSN